MCYKQDQVFEIGVFLKRVKLELLRYLCILVIIDKNYWQMIDILHSTACVIALYKIIEAALGKI